MASQWSRTIRIDNEVYAWLQSQAVPLKDTPNMTLRRIAGLDKVEKPKKKGQHVNKSK